MNETIPILLAVASKEGFAISEHFGHAKSFLIYQATPQQCRLLEQRVVEHYCLGNHSSKCAMAKILETVRDCRAVFVAKIGDDPTDKLFMTHLYHALKDRPGELLGDDFHQLIAMAEGNLDDGMRNHIYELRALAETRISRPVMKGFKTLIREQGLFDVEGPA